MAKKTVKDAYGNQSISQLKGADRVRKRPSVIFGSDGLEGCEHSVFEILSNSIDEAREGYGNQIILTRYEDKSIEIEDFARGVPVDWNENEQKYNWDLIYCEMYAGGKYKNIEGESYEYSLGLNGLGSCATQYASEYMDVTVFRDGFKYSLHFEKGVNRTPGEAQLIKEPYAGKRTGTIQRWRPDLDVFTDIDIPLEYFGEMLRMQAVTNAGVRFTLRNQVGGKFDTTEYFYKNGIVDYVNEMTAEGEDPESAPLTSVRFIAAERRGRDREDKPEYKVKMSAAFCFTNTNPFIRYFHSSSWLEHGGAPDKAAKNAFVYAVDKYLKDNGKYQKNESRVTFADITECLALVTNSFSTFTSYENQTKKAINNKFIQEAMTDFFRSELEVYLTENKQEAEKLTAQVLINKRARENADKTRLGLKKKLAGELDINNRVDKFVDCRTKDLTRREIYIVEGDSALGSCKMGRDAEFQAVFPVRGKILNCLKSDYSKIFKSEIITDLIKVLGCGVEMKTQHKDVGSFDLSSLRWSKVIICTDADFDGYHIRTLILSMIYRLMPTLIQQSVVYIAESPLYEITCRDKTYFAFNENEKSAVLEKIGGKPHTIQRSKGLGENEPDMMWETTMNPETRRLVRVMPDDAEKTAWMFDALMGDNIAARKDFITEFGPKYIELADIS